MPSLWWENQPLVAIEAMINGIPVIGSNRGGIPETLGEGGFALPLPNRLTPLTKIVPSAEEVEPWVETIIRLWDDRAPFQEQVAKARTEAKCWHPERSGCCMRSSFGTCVISLWRRSFQGLGTGDAMQCSLSGNGTGTPKPNGEQDFPSHSSHASRDYAVLKANLLRSPELVGPDSPHEVILIHKVAELLRPA